MSMRRQACRTEVGNYSEFYKHKMRARFKNIEIYLKKKCIFYAFFFSMHFFFRNRYFFNFSPFLRVPDHSLWLKSTKNSFLTLNTLFFVRKAQYFAKSQKKLKKCIFLFENWPFKIANFGLLGGRIDVFMASYDD